MKVELWSVETGQRIERWSVDARGMVDSGEWVDDPAELPKDVPPTVDEGAVPSAPALSGGYRIEATENGWYKAFGPDGEQIGKSQRSEEQARALIPAVNQPGGQPGRPAEHSPGVPLTADEG